jgi:hypothetical protein
MRYDNYSVFVLIGQRGVSEDAFCARVRERGREVGAESLLFFSEPDGYLTAYLFAPATEEQRSRGYIIPFRKALQWVFNREGYPAEGEPEEDTFDLPLLYIERVSE